MNNNLKLIIVAATSFVLGVVATKILSPDHYSIAITPRQKELQKIAIEAERRPFFPNAKTETAIVPASPVQPETPKEAQAPAQIIASPKDYLAISEELSKFSNQLFMELKKRFKSIPLNTKDNRETMNNQHLRNSLEFLFQEKELWYKSTVDDDLSQSKMYLFFKYYNCQAKEPKPGIKLSETCYMFQLFNFRGGVWYQSNISSQVNGLLWNNDVPYVQIELTGLGDFSKDTGAFFAVVPTPNEQMAMQFLKYEEGKVSWIEGKDVRWSKSSQKEIDKFEAWTHR